MWVKRMDVTGAQYVDVENVDLEQTVSKVKARWVALAKLDVDPSLVTLRLVKCGARKPSAEEEQQAVELNDPSLSLAEAGVTGTAWLLAVFATDKFPSPSGGVHSSVLQRLERLELSARPEGPLFSPTSRATTYRNVVAQKLLRSTHSPAWFQAADTLALTESDIPAPESAESVVQAFFNGLAIQLSSAENFPTLRLVDRSTMPPYLGRKPDVVGYKWMPESTTAEMLPQSPMHICCVGNLKSRRSAGREGVFTDAEKGHVLGFAEDLVHEQPWRAAAGGPARVVAFLSDGAHITFFECTFTAALRPLGVAATLQSVSECGLLRLAASGGAFLSGLTRAPLERIGYSPPQVRVDGQDVAIRAFLGMGATAQGFLAEWRGSPVVLKLYNASGVDSQTRMAEVAALQAARGVRGVVQLVGQSGMDALLLQPVGRVRYSIRAPPRPGAAALSAAPAPVGASDAEVTVLRPTAADFCDLVDALAALHTVGWVHRDPRPENFYRCSRGHLFLSDLGSAVEVGDGSRDALSRAWAFTYGPLAVLQALDTGLEAPVPTPAHDFEQVARLVYAALVRATDSLPALDGFRSIRTWWATQDATLPMGTLLTAAAAAHRGAAEREAFKLTIRSMLAG